MTDRAASLRRLPDVPDVAPVANSPTEVLSVLSVTRCPLRSSASTARARVDIYVDDTPANVKSLRAMRLYAICFANSTNKAVAAPRVGSWEAVYKLVHTRWVANIGRRGSH